MSAATEAVMRHIIAGLEDVVAEDENGFSIPSAPIYLNVDQITDPDDPSDSQIGVQTTDGHRFFVTVEQYD
jgi:hypothetical protein